MLPAVPRISVAIGVRGTNPTPPPGNSSSTTDSSAGRAISANRTTVLRSNTSRGVKTTPADFARETSEMATMLSPPSAKNESSTPTRSIPRTDAAASAMMRSTGPLGAR
ncbi:hypothetical protein BKP42_20590 [Rhodococcus erythropolis]|nr:hypothetical protein BKP42_20590 [Rhodococcus erythropolis]